MKKGVIRDYQTPPEVCRYMVSLLPNIVGEVFEPTPGKGNLVKAAEEAGYKVFAAKDYFLCNRYTARDAVIMNPPFSVGSLLTENKPASFIATGMDVGYQILFECLQNTNHCIALMPWFTISDSDVRLRYIKKWGLKSVTLLPRSTFNYGRIQTVILEMDRYLPRYWETVFKVYDLLPKIPSKQQLLQTKAEFI